MGDHSGVGIEYSPVISGMTPDVISSLDGLTAAALPQPFSRSKALLGLSSDVSTTVLIRTILGHDVNIAESDIRRGV